MQELSLDFFTIGLVWYIAFLFSTTCHEGAHALAAKLGGDPTAFHGGQVTLNPIPHIQRTPFGMVVIPVLAYFFSGWMIGFASTPYDPHWAARHPRRAAWMALAGPAANFTLMLLAAVGIRLGLAVGVLQAPARPSFTGIVEAVDPSVFGLPAMILSIFFVLNLLLGTFNLLPLPPLDGNVGITVFMSEKKALDFLDFTRSFGMMGIVVAWFLFGRLFSAVFLFALNALYFPLASYG